MMRDEYAAKFRDLKVPLPEIVSVSARVFYGEGYEDSDRRIPDITKAKTLLDWEPKWRMREMLETTMTYFVEEYRSRHAGAPVTAVK
jgi:UDP-apiose/xylose synthase